MPSAALTRLRRAQFLCDAGCRKAERTRSGDWSCRTGSLAPRRSRHQAQGRSGQSGSSQRPRYQGPPEVTHRVVDRGSDEPRLNAQHLGQRAHSGCRRIGALGVIDQMPRVAAILSWEVVARAKQLRRAQGRAALTARNRSTSGGRGPAQRARTALRCRWHRRDVAELRQCKSRSYRRGSCFHFDLLQFRIFKACVIYVTAQRHFLGYDNRSRPIPRDPVAGTGIR